MMSKRNIVVTVVAGHICVLFVAGLIGGCAKEKKKSSLASVHAVEDVRAPESAPESILEPEDLVEETELLVALEPEAVPTKLEGAPEREEESVEAEEVSREPEAAREKVPAIVAREEVAAVIERGETGKLKPPVIPRLRPSHHTPPPSPGKRSHRVAPGESLWKIGRAYGVTVADLAAVNEIEPNAILRVGQILVLPEAPSPEAEVKPAEATDEAPPAAREGEFGKHTVRKGEVLWSIAKKYGVPLKEIVEVNAIEDPARIKAGQVLIIPK